MAIDVVLPQPFTPATMMTVGPLGAKRIGSAGWANSVLSFVLMLFEDFRHFDDPGAERLADLVGDFLRGLDAHVGLDERSNRSSAECFVDQPALRFEQVADVGVQQLRGLLETLLQFVE